jgi:hypothetical protein
MSEIEQDFLEVDAPITGQNYALLSFISPESMIEKRELFMVKHFLASIYQKEVQRKKDEKEAEAKADTDDKNKDSVSKEGYYTGLKPGYILPESFSNFLESYEDFKFTNDDKVMSEFNKQNSNSTSVRGVKVRGVYDVLEHARKKAKQLQTNDPSFNVFVGQVGYWLPWDPSSKSHQIEDEVFANQQLNDLMQKYKENNTSRDLFYQELTQERIEYSKKQNTKENKENEDNEENDQTLAEAEESSKSNFKEVVKNIF